MAETNPVTDTLARTRMGMTLLVLLSGLVAVPSSWANPTSVPLPGPPVPGQSSEWTTPVAPPVYPRPEPVNVRPLPTATFQSPALNTVLGAQMVDGELRIAASPGSQLLVKARFVLPNPSRLVIDLDQAELADKTLVMAGGNIGPLPFNSVRLAQFDATTVRVVVETPAADKLNVSLGNNHLLRVYAPRFDNFASRFLGRFLGNRPQPQPTRTAAVNPFPLPPNRPDVRPVIGPPPSILATTPPNRYKIVDIARSQLGVSKAVDRDYVNNTFSRGKDQAWCADFVSTILEWSGGSPWGHTALVRDIYDWGVTSQRLRPFPEPGDVAIFRFSVSGFDHTAIVENINPDNTLTTIGGNEGGSSGVAPGGMVQRTVYKLEDPRILGFVTPL